MSPQQPNYTLFHCPHELHCTGTAVVESTLKSVTIKCNLVVGDTEIYCKLVFRDTTFFANLFWGHRNKKNSFHTSKHLKINSRIFLKFLFFLFQFFFKFKFFIFLQYTIQIGLMVNILEIVSPSL